MLPLFDEPSPFDRAALGARLRALAAEDILIGASSWKYEGWLGQIYTPERYLARGKFSRKRFQSECLAEYAETFPIVCGDFSFYQFPSPQYWEKLFASAPSSLRFALKVPEEVTAESFPKHARYGPRAGLANEAYLNADPFEALFLGPLTPYRARVPCLILEFGASRSSSARIRAAAGLLSRGAAGFVSLCGRGAKSGVPHATLLRLPSRAKRRSRFQCVEPHAADFRANGP